MYALFSEYVGGGKGLISQIGVVGKSECKLSVGEVVLRGWAVVQPLEEVSEGKEALVEGAHNLRV